MSQRPPGPRTRGINTPLQNHSLSSPLKVSVVMNSPRASTRGVFSLFL